MDSRTRKPAGYDTHHEAGHAVTLAIFAGPGKIESVTVEGVGAFNARTALGSPTTILAALAGAAFEWRHTGLHTPASPSDAQLFETACAAQGLEARRAAADAQGILVDLMREPPVRRAHKRIVNALAKWTTIDGRKVDSLLDWGELQAVCDKYRARAGAIGR